MNSAKGRPTGSGKWIDGLSAEMALVPAIELLRDRLKSRRQRTQRKLVRKLPKFEDDLRQVGDELLDEIPSAVPTGPTPQATVGQIGARVLLQEMTRLWKWTADSIDNPD